MSKASLAMPLVQTLRGPPYPGCPLLAHEDKGHGEVDDHC